VSDPWGWQAHVSDDAHNWAADTFGVTFYKRHDNGGQQIIGFDDSGWPIVGALEPHAVPRPAFRIPREAVRALAEAVKPGPSQGEVKRLEEALAVERRRVDDIARAAVDACADVVRASRVAVTGESAPTT
jgi:hypothetical protein